jgi:hypothetical protein
MTDTHVGTDEHREVVGLGRIFEWPGGYAMTLGIDRWCNSVVRCCSGHPTTEEAKSHGLARVVEVALATADRDLATWAVSA